MKRYYLGGSITIAVANGGAPGIIFEFLASCVYYGFVATSIAELASSIPSAGGGTYVRLIYFDVVSLYLGTNHPF